MIRNASMPEIVLDRAKPWPLHRQIHSQLASAIRTGQLTRGTRLPSTRLLARILGISRNTVVCAYEQLLEDGLIETRAGSGVRVSHAAAPSVPNFSNLRRTARAAHYPVRTVLFTDGDGTPLYLNTTR